MVMVKEYSKFCIYIDINDALLAHSHFIIRKNVLGQWIDQHKIEHILNILK